MAEDARRTCDSTAIDSASTPPSRRTAAPTTPALVSPKGGAVFGPFAKTEIYVNAGLGFHSNDARGATITVDPVTGEPARRVTPLARATGAEIGLRTVRIPRLQMTLTAWTLGLDSELVFVGDAGTTDAGRPSRRQGIEWTTYYTPKPWFVLDADVALSHARFTDGDPAGDHIPGAVATVVSAGATVEPCGNVFGSMRWRYFGPRALVEDNSVRSKATSLVNLTAGYKLTSSVRVALDVFNLFNAADSDIDYFYRSRLPGEPAGGIDDSTPSGGAAHGAAQSDCGILTSRQSVVSHSRQSQSQRLSGSASSLAGLPRSVLERAD